MTDSNTPLPTPGWYPDPAGGPRTRWWNGSSWSDSYGEPAAAAAQAAEPAAAVSGTPWASPSAGQPTAPDRIVSAIPPSSQLDGFECLRLMMFSVARRR